MLNATVIEELRSLPADDGGDLFTQFGKMFLAAFPDHIAQMRSYLSSNDLRSLERESHTLKSVCGNLGAEALADIARQIEKATKANQTQAVPRLIDQMANDYQAVKEELEQLLTKGLKK